MPSALVTLLRGSTLVLTAAASASVCDPSFDCVWYYTDNHNTLFEYNFSQLCLSSADYNWTEGDNDFAFNVCGLAHAYCNPEYPVRYRVGRAVQLWGAKPPCNASAPDCVNADTGVPECCTRPCEVLATGPPLWSLLDASNPTTGGIRLTYWGVPSIEGAPFQCPPDNITGAAISRSFTINLHCNKDLAPGELVILGVDEPTQCRYIADAETVASCACKPNCTHRLCGPDGCGGSCSGAGFALPDGCPVDYVCIGGDCCRRDCRNRNCGSDGCGGDCGTCGNDEVCLLPHQYCVSQASQRSDDDMLDPQGDEVTPVYAIDAAGLTGAYVGGICATLVLAGVVYFFFGGGKEAFDRWRLTDADIRTTLIAEKPSRGGITYGTPTR